MPHGVFKPSRRDKKTGKIKRSRYWSGQYRLDNDLTYTRFSLKTTDKRVAEQQLAEIVKQEERRRAGILAPEAQTQAAAKSLADHLQEFIVYLRIGNRSREYYRKVDQRVTRLIADCGWKLLRDVSAESFIGWRNRQNLSAKTLNDYQHAIFTLLKWLKQTQRIMYNPLEHVGRVDGRGRQTFTRRALTDAEVERLLTVSGPRRAVYLAAVHTGLRRGELRKLRWSDVDLDAGKLRLRAEATKARRADVLPLSPIILGIFRQLREESASSSRVFRGGIPSHHTFQTDLEAAKIARTNADGKKVDFHALRKTFITNLQRSGASQRVAMALARHTDPRLTAHNYTDTDALPLVSAVAALPTYGLGNDAHRNAHGDAQTAVSGGPSVSQDDADSTSSSVQKSLEKQESTCVEVCQRATPNDAQNKWSRGESNPRPGTVSTAPLRVCSALWFRRGHRRRRRCLCRVATYTPHGAWRRRTVWGARCLHPVFYRVSNAGRAT